MANPTYTGEPWPSNTCLNEIARGSSGAGGGGSTAGNQTSGAQKTQVVDGAGNVIGATANALDINIKSGALAPTSVTSTRVSSAAYEASKVLKASAGVLVSLIGYNSRTSAQFIQLFNSATVPADATAPAVVFTVPASSNFSLDVPITGMPFTTGISVANSSTGPTKTVGSADVYFTAVVI